MGFWIYMLIMDLLLPIVMILFGGYFFKKAPKELSIKKALLIYLPLVSDKLIEKFVAIVFAENNLYA